MAELKSYEHAENFSNPDDLQLSNDHESTRLQRQTQAAQAEVSRSEIDGGLSDFFDSFDARNRNSINRLTIDTSNRVIDVLQSSADNYKSSLNSGSSAGLEKLAWDKYQGDILTRLGDIDANTNTSISLAEGYEKFLAEAQSKTEKEWEDQKASNAQALQQFGRWDQLFKARKYEKFEAAADEKIQAMFSELNKNMAQVKKEAQTRATNMENRVKQTWEGVVDPTQKNNHWVEIQSAVTATDIASVNAPLFLGAAASDQNKVDFVEALGRLDFVRSGLGLAEKSAQIHENQKDLIKSGHEQQKLIDLNGNFKFESLLSKPIFKDYPKNPENAPTDKELLSSILADLQRETANIESLFGKTVKKQELLTDSAKLVILVRELDRSNAWREHLSSNTRQKYVDWMEKQEEETKSEVTPYNDTEANAILTEITGRLAPSLETQVKAASACDISKTSYTDIINISDECLTISQDIALKLNQLENIEALPEEDKGTLSQELIKMKGFAESLAQIAQTWNQEKRRYSDWKTAKNNAKKGMNTNIAHLDAIINDGAKSHKERTSASYAKEKLIDRFEEKAKNEPRQTPITTIQAMLSDINVIRHGNFTLSSSINAPNIESLDKRIRRHIGTELKGELEQKFIEKMEQNDQYELMAKMPVGTKVQVTQQVAGATSSIDFPRQLNGSNGDFRITRVVEGKGVQLENIAGDKVLTLLGAFASGGEVFKNGILATKNRSGTVSTGQAVLAYNFKII